MQIAQRGLQEFLNWKYPDLCAHWRAVNLFFNPFISVSPAFTMKFFTISANCKCSGAFFSHMQTFMAQMAAAASTQRWAAPQGVGGTAWAGISHLCWVRCRNSHFQGMPRELNVLTLCGAYGWRTWRLRQLAEVRRHPTAPAASGGNAWWELTALQPLGTRLGYSAVPKPIWEIQCEFETGSNALQHKSLLSVASHKRVIYCKFYDLHHVKQSYNFKDQRWVWGLAISTSGLEPASNMGTAHGKDAKKLREERKSSLFTSSLILVLPLITPQGKSVQKS